MEPAIKKFTHNETLQLLPADNKRLALLCGQFDENLRQLEQYLDVIIQNRGNDFAIKGSTESAHIAVRALNHLYKMTEQEDELTPAMIHLYLQGLRAENDEQEFVESLTKTAKIKPRGANQASYIKKIKQFDVNFGIGPAGTGKTYLAVAAAVDALQHEQVRRIILARPAIEAGEKLGFLPGDIAEKVNPYLRPLYDALYDMLEFEYVAKLIERNVIEIVPFAYMRGRTLNDAFIIMDEGQNTTPEQMKMFLTRIGFGSKAIITGDITQVDLPKGQLSGLQHAINLLAKIDDIGFTYFENKDIIRHPLVKKIIHAYDEEDNK